MIRREGWYPRKVLKSQGHGSRVALAHAAHLASCRAIISFTAEVLIDLFRINCLCMKHACFRHVKGSKKGSYVMRRSWLDKKIILRLRSLHQHAQGTVI